MSADDPKDNTTALMQRLGNEVRDHETRIRLLERDMLLISEGLRQVKDVLTGVNNGMSNIDRRLDEHMQKEDRDRARLMAATLGQFLAVLIGIILVLLGR